MRLVDCRFGETGGDRLIVLAAIRVVWNRRHVGRDVIHELLKSLVERLGGLGLRVDIPRHLLENLERRVNAAVPEKGLSATQLAQTSLFPVGSLGFVELNTFQRLGQHGHSHGVEWARIIADPRPSKNRTCELAPHPAQAWIGRLFQGAGTRLSPEGVVLWAMRKDRRQEE